MQGYFSKTYRKDAGFVKFDVKWSYYIWDVSNLFVALFFAYGQVLITGLTGVKEKSNGKETSTLSSKLTFNLGKWNDASPTKLLIWVDKHCLST